MEQPTAFDREFTVILRLKKAKTRRWSLEAMRRYLLGSLDEVTIEAIYPGRLIPSEKELNRDYPEVSGHDCTAPGSCQDLVRAEAKKRRASRANA